MNLGGAGIRTPGRRNGRTGPFALRRKEEAMTLSRNVWIAIAVLAIVAAIIVVVLVASGGGGGGGGGY